MPHFVAIDSELVVVAVKDGGRPTDDEMAHLFEQSKMQGDFRYTIRGYSVAEVVDVYRMAQKSSTLPDAASMKTDAVIQHGISLMVGSIMQSKKIKGSFSVLRTAGDTSLGLYVFQLTDEAKVVTQPFHAATPPPAVPAWKFWGKPPAPTFEDAHTTMNGYSLACGPAVIARYKDRNPSPYRPCAFEIKRLDKTEQRNAELSFQLTCPDCEKTYAFTNSLSGSEEGVREVHVKCPTCSSHRWILRTLSYWNKGQEAWVFNVSAVDKYLHAANPTVTNIQPR
jgi:hypothetical protein